MDAERGNEPWIEQVRRRCPLLDLGFRLDTPPEPSPPDPEEPPPPTEECFTDDFAELADPHECLRQELERAGLIAWGLVERLAGHPEADTLLPLGQGLAFLEGVNAAHGAGFAAALAEAGHKLPLVFAQPVSPGNLAGQLDAFLTDFGEVRQGIALADLLQQILARLDQDVG